MKQQVKLQTSLPMAWHQLDGSSVVYKTPYISRLYALLFKLVYPMQTLSS